MLFVFCQWRFFWTSLPTSGLSSRYRPLTYTFFIIVFV